MVLCFYLFVFLYNANMELEAKGEMPDNTLTPVQFGTDLPAIYNTWTKYNRVRETSHENKLV